MKLPKIDETVRQEILDLWRLKKDGTYVEFRPKKEGRGSYSKALKDRTADFVYPSLNALAKHYGKNVNWVNQHLAKSGAFGKPVVDQIQEIKNMILQLKPRLQDVINNFSKINLVDIGYPGSEKWKEVEPLLQQISDHVHELLHGPIPWQQMVIFAKRDSEKDEAHNELR